MEIPQEATRGSLFSHKRCRVLSEEKITSFTIVSRELDDAIFIQWETPNFYSVAMDGNYMSKYNSIQGILTKRKNGKWMFKGHQRLYANEEVQFY